MRKNIINLKYLTDSKDELTKKKETIKTIAVINFLDKHQGKLQWINIYNNFIFFKEKRCDLYFEDIKKKEVIVIKIVKKKTKEKIKEMKEELERIDFDIFQKRIEIWDIDKFSEDIFEIDSKIKEYLK